MGLTACFRRPPRRDHYLRHHNCYSSSPPPPSTPSSAPPPTLPRHPAPSFCFADWIKLRCLGGGNNNRKRKAAAAGSDHNGRGRQPERVRKLKKKQVRAGRSNDDDSTITLREFLIRSPSRQPNNKVYPYSQLDGTGGGFSLEMLLEIDEENKGGDDKLVVVSNGRIIGSDDGEGDWTNSSSRKRRVSFRLPGEGDIFTYDPSDNDEEEEENLIS